MNELKNECWDCWISELNIKQVSTELGMWNCLFVDIWKQLDNVYVFYFSYVNALFIYKVVCLFVCPIITDSTPWPICLKFLLGNSGEPRASKF